MDPMASLLYVDQDPRRQALIGVSMASPLSSTSSTSPPGSSLDFSMSGLSPPNDFTSTWEATLQQFTQPEQQQAPFYAGGQLWGAPVAKQAVLPFSFGGPAPNIASMPSPISPFNYPDYNGFSTEMDAATLPNNDFFAGLGGAGNLFTYAQTASGVDPATISAPPVTISPPTMVEPALFGLQHGFDRRASVGGIVSPSSLSGFQPESEIRKKRRISEQMGIPVSSATIQPAQLTGKPFVARMPQVSYDALNVGDQLQAIMPPQLPTIAIDEPSTGDKRKAPSKEDEHSGAHNAVERRYRTKINGYIVSLQSLVPALAHLVDPPDVAPTHRRKSSAFVLSTAPSIPAGTVIDGVPAAGKLSKGVVLGKSLEYIRHLRRERERLQVEREISHAVLAEYVEGHEQLLAEVERRWAIRKAEIEAGYAAADAEEDANEAAAAASAGARAPRRSAGAPKGAAKGKRAKKDSDSDESEGDDDIGVSSSHLAAVDPSGMRARKQARTTSTQVRFPPSPDTSSPDGVTPPGPPRAMLAVFAGVSFIGGLGYDLANASDGSGAEAASAVSWAPRDLVKRAFVADDAARSGASFLASTTAAPGSAILFLGVASVVGWICYLAWPLLGAMVGHHRALSARRRRTALEALQAPAKPGEGELARARRAREALTTLARMPTHAVGAFFGLTWEAALGAVGVKSRGFGGASTEDEKHEVALALVRLAELETAYSVDLCCLTQRLYAFVRLHNLSHSPMWPIDGNPALSPARVNATLALQLVSIFGSQASPLSRRRRLWKSAVAEPKREDELAEAWVGAALGADYDEATAVLQRATPICGRLASPSDTVPLLRVAEARCEKALIEIWTSLFVSVIGTTCTLRPGDAPLPGIPSDMQARIDQVLAATVPGSPLHTLARLTLGVFVLGAGDLGSARQIALQLALEARDAGPAAGLASVAGFARLLLGDAVALFLHAGEPAGRLDGLAAAGVGWLLIRQRVAAKDGRHQPAKVDRDLYEAARSLRQLLGGSVFRREGLAEAQLRCVEALEGVGRRAAGLAEVESDSGFESDD